MILKQTLKQVEESKEYKKFIKESPDFYLTHCFTMMSAEDKKFAWEFGYYSKKKDKVVVFESVPKIKQRPEEDTFKKEGVISCLDMKKVRIAVKNAIETCEALVQEKYGGQTITKYIIILQNLEKATYNITVVTMSFNIINIHIDASSGKVIKSNIQSIMNLGRPE